MFGIAINVAASAVIVAAVGLLGVAVVEGDNIIKQIKLSLKGYYRHHSSNQCI
jgi:hypothetical protein